MAGRPRKFSLVNGADRFHESLVGAITQLEQKLGRGGGMGGSKKEGRRWAYVRRIAHRLEGCETGEARGGHTRGGVWEQ